jgi:serine protease Do
MKQFMSLVFAAILGGALSLGGYQLLQDHAPAPLLAESYAQAVSNINVPARANMPYFDFKEAAAKAMPAVVHISATVSQPARANHNDPFRFFFGDDFMNPYRDGRPPSGGTGSGVIYTSDGYIITNNHVVASAQELEVKLYDNRKFKARLIGTDERSDLAVIKIEGYDFPYLELANSDEAEVGEWVLAVGNPFDLTSTVTAGIISAKGRNINLLGGGRAIESFIQTDAAVNPGNSGGALVDAQGRLLGINTAIATRTGAFSGYSFAIPVNLAAHVADDIIEYGSFQRTFLGVTIVDLDSEYAEELGVNISQGVVIEELVDGGSAQYAGLLPKDIIIGVNGRMVKSVPELQEIVGRSKVGDVLRVKINRRGKVQDVEVRMRAG